MARELGGFTQIVLFVMLSIIVILFFGLSNLGNDVEFKSVVIFTLTFLGSFYTLLFISVTPVGERIAGKNASLFFFQPMKLSLPTLGYIGLGIGGAFAFSVIANLSGLDENGARLFAIGGAGFTFLFILFRTKSILVPILSHGFFNTLVITLRSNVFGAELLSSNPFPVPQIGITLGSLNTLASEAIWMFTLVAPAEEFLKALVLSFVFLSLKGKFENKGIVAYVIAGTFSVVLWMVFHLIRGGTNI